MNCASALAEAFFAADQYVRIVTFHRVLLTACLPCAAAFAACAEVTWIDQAADDGARVHLYFFWSQHCPHCLAAIPFVQSLTREHLWLVVHSHELTNSQNNVTLNGI